MAVAPLEIPKDALADFCRRHSIRKLSLFGSVLTDRFSDSSDIDVLVEFEPEARVGYLGLARMEAELSDWLGRKFDLRTPGELSKYFRDEVIRTAAIQYVRQ
jgi:uncharacterized protein